MVGVFSLPSADDTCSALFAVLDYRSASSLYYGHRCLTDFSLGNQFYLWD